MSPASYTFWELIWTRKVGGSRISSVMRRQESSLCRFFTALTHALANEKSDVLKFSCREAGLLLRVGDLSLGVGDGGD